MVWAHMNVDPDERPQNVVSDQGLHCLLKIQEFKVNQNSPLLVPFSQHTPRDN